MVSVDRRTRQKTIEARITAAEPRLGRRFAALTLGFVVVECSLERREGHRRRFAWHGSSATTNGNAVHGWREHTIGRQGFAFTGWFAHTECVVGNVHGASGGRDDGFGVLVVIREANGPPDVSGV